MAILFAAIGGYSIRGYWRLFYSSLLAIILFVTIGDYSIHGYSINGYWWVFYLSLFYSWLLVGIIFVVILLMVIGGY
jgi:hypothetical protein